MVMDSGLKGTTQFGAARMHRIGTRLEHPIGRVSVQVRRISRAPIDPLQAGISMSRRGVFTTELQYEQLGGFCPLSRYESNDARTPHNPVGTSGQ